MKTLYALALAACLAVSAAVLPAEAAPPQVMTPQEAKALMARPSDVTILDVRTQAEYDGGHIPGAVLLPAEAILAGSDDVAAVVPDKDRAVIVYCRTGRRSSRAAAALYDMGYTAVYDLGGIVNWPYETVQ